MSTKQQQQHYLEWMRIQLSKAELNGLNTNRAFNSELVEMKTKWKYIRWLVVLFTVQQTWF